MLPALLSVYPSASADTTSINNLFFWFLLAAGIVFAAIIGSITYIIFRFNKKKTPVALNQQEGNKKFEIGIAILAFSLVVIFLVYTLKTITTIQPVKRYSKPDIIIIGHQWWWEMIYPNDSITTANELHIPAGKKLLVKLSSADVIHDWWVPALGRKMDMIPGQDNFFYIEANHTGIYDGTCSEFCGTQHAWMRIKVFAEDSLDYSNWINQQKSPIQETTSALAQQGKILFESKSCASCHQIQGTVAKESFGPDLTHLATRTTLLAGKKKYSFENLKKWIADTQSQKPGANMPNFILSDEEVTAIATYLNQLN